MSSESESESELESDTELELKSNLESDFEYLQFFLRRLLLGWLLLIAYWL